MTSSSNVDDRTQHEIYTHPFLRSVMAGVASIMCSYSARFAHRQGAKGLLTQARPHQRYLCM